MKSLFNIIYNLSKMSFNLINDKEFKFKQIKKVGKGTTYKINTDNNDIIYIETPFMTNPFGIEKKLNDDIIKLQFDGVKDNTNKNNITFFDFVKELEMKILNDFNKFQTKQNIIHNNLYIKSQIVYKHNKYDDLLIITFNKKFHNVDIYKKDGEIKNIYDLNKNDLIKCYLTITNLWVTDEFISYKYHINKITIS